MSMQSQTLFARFPIQVHRTVSALRIPQITEFWCLTAVAGY